MLNEQPKFNGNVIYAVNHSCVHDIPIAIQVIKKHFYLLMGKQDLEVIDRIFFNLNGTVWVDRKNRDNRRKAVSKMKNLLRGGQNLLMFPEGTWNYLPSSPMLPLYWGIIDLAKHTDTPILPIVFEFREKECWVKYGKLVKVEKNCDKSEEINRLTDIFATLKWEIWEQFPQESRKDILGNEWSAEMDRRVSEYPKFNREYEKSCARMG